LVGIQLESENHPEPVAQRGRKLSRSGGRPDQRKARQRQMDGRGALPLAVYYISREILHGGIEGFLNDAGQAVYLVYEKNVALLEIGQHCGEVARTFDCRTRGYADVYPHLVRDYPRQGCLAQARRAVQQHMVKRLAAKL